MRRKVSTPVGGRARALRSLGAGGLLVGGFAAGAAMLTARTDPIAGAANPDYRPPTITLHSATRYIENHAARTRLQIEARPDAIGRLLFLEARPAVVLADGRTAWPEASGGRLVLFDERLRVIGAAQGTPDGLRVLAEPLAAVALGSDVLAVEGDGAMLRFRRGAPVGWVRPHNVRGVVGAMADDQLIASRSIAEFELSPVQRQDPLLWVLDSQGRVIRTIDSVEVPSNAFLGQLVNAGSVATDARGNIYFASALRPEVRRYRPDGRVDWISVRSSFPVPPPPTLVADNGSVRPQFTVVHHAIAVGDDERVYVLGSSGDGGRPDRLFVYDGDGRLAGEGAVPAMDAVLLGDDGRLTTMEPGAVLARSVEAERSPFVPFAVPALADTGVVRLADYAGRIVVVNVWASWCGPCRREMPQMNALARELAGQPVTVLGLNEDTNRDAAVSFLDEFGITYPNGAGQGRLREQFGYRGLPYTVVLDDQHRVVRAMYGFGDSIEPVRRVVLDELARRHVSDRRTVAPSGSAPRR